MDQGEGVGEARELTAIAGGLSIANPKGMLRFVQAALFVAITAMLVGCSDHTGQLDSLRGNQQTVQPAPGAVPTAPAGQGLPTLPAAGTAPSSLPGTAAPPGTPAAT